MSGSWSTHQPPRREGPQEIKEQPTDITQLNDSVYQLYSPHRSTSQDLRKVVVIFFHGLPQSHDNYREAFWKTWLSRDGTVVWPKDWLSKSLEAKAIEPQILSISYDSYAISHPGETDTYLIAENLIFDIIFNDSVSQNCPVVLVGHCLGGTIIKRFLLGCLTRRAMLANIENAQRDVQRINNFMGNCKGVFFYSTPHAGSQIIDNLAQQSKRKFNDPLMKLLKTLSAETARINSDFATARLGEGIRTEGIVEGLDTTYLGFRGKFVEESSARQDVENFYTASDANHFDVCKAKNNTSCNIHQNLRRFITTAVEMNLRENETFSRTR